MSVFFSASCVPVNNPKNYPSSLCALCVGDEQGRNKCVGSSQERYYGHSGAFRYPVGWGRAAGQGAWGQGPGWDLLPIPVLTSCVAGAWLRMQGTLPLSSTRRSLTIQMVCVSPGTGQSQTGRALPHLQQNLALDVPGIAGQVAAGKD